MRTYAYQGYGSQMYVGTGGDTDAIHITTKVGTALAAQGVAIAAAGGIGKTAAATSVVKLLSLAGVSSSAPVVGWVVAAGAVLAAGITSFISAAKARGIREDQVAYLATQMGFPQAAAYPDFVFDAMKEGPQWRKYKARQLEKKIAKGKGKEWINKSQLAFLGVMEVYAKAEARLAAGLRAAPPTAAEVRALQLRSDEVQAAIHMDYKNRQFATGAIVAFTLIGIYALLKPD